MSQLKEAKAELLIFPKSKINNNRKTKEMKMHFKKEEYLMIIVWYSKKEVLILVNC